MRTIIQPTLAAMKARGTPFTGILYAGLMLTAHGPYLIEYNVRFGDPEAQVLLPRLQSDLVEAMMAAIDGTLGRIALSWSDDVALTVVLAAPGYPGQVETGSVIRGLAGAEARPEILVFQAGTAERDGAVVAQGGRVLAVTATAPTFAAAKARAYAAVRLIDWPEGFHRTDIGDRAIRREEDSHAG
jgi:phosphoribosylamine--glycine ligase